MAMTQHFNIYLRPEPAGGYTVTVPALPGCVTYGKTVAEAKQMAGEAIGAYLESMQKHGEALTTDNDSLFGSVDVAFSA